MRRSPSARCTTGASASIVAVPPRRSSATSRSLPASTAGRRLQAALAPDLEWTTNAERSSTRSRSPSATEPTAKDKNRTAEGPQVALLWRHGDQIELLPKNPGKVEEVPARRTRQGTRSTRSSPRSVETPVLTIFLNEDYSPLKKYLQGRQRDLTKIGSGHAYNRYAIDVGVALLVIHHAEEQRRKRGEHLDENPA